MGTFQSDVSKLKTQWPRDTKKHIFKLDNREGSVVVMFMSLLQLLFP